MISIQNCTQYSGVELSVWLPTVCSTFQWVTPIKSMVQNLQQKWRKRGRNEKAYSDGRSETRHFGTDLKIRGVISLYHTSFQYLTRGFNFLIWGYILLRSRVSLFVIISAALGFVFLSQFHTSSQQLLWNNTKEEFRNPVLFFFIFLPTIHFFSAKYQRTFAIL